MADDEVCDQSEIPAARTQTNTCQPPYVPARILWPALGFPEIVDPAGTAAADDHTSKIHVLLFAATDKLTPAIVARHLRWVAWDKRRTRFLPVGTQSFPREQIVVNPVRPDPTQTPLTYQIGMADKTIALALAIRVWDFYKGLWKTCGLYEATISQSASAAVPKGLSNLMWINRNPKDDEIKPAEEMNDLLNQFVKPRLKKEFPMDFIAPFKDSDDMAMDYEYEWPSPTGQPRPVETVLPRQSPSKRVEVLHPLFIGPAAKGAQLRIAHLTDTHVATRHDVLELRMQTPAPGKDDDDDLPVLDEPSKDHDRLLEGEEKKRTSKKPKGTMLPAQRWKSFNNMNRRFEEHYGHAKSECDVLLLTGDLVDYGRGHIGFPGKSLGDVRNYWLDRNWFLFYRLLAQDSLYSSPVYTCLGNHDWRLNPYAPVGPDFTMSEQHNVTDQELILLHGSGATDRIYYDSWKDFIPDYLKATVDWLAAEFGPNTTSDRMPLVTTTESVIWYLLLINPFLDYSVRLPGNYALLMLDWARNEQVLSIAPLKTGDPMAEDSLSDVQRNLVNHFVDRDVKAKILGIHAPLVAPYNWWPTSELEQGWVTKDGETFPVIVLADTDDDETPFPPGKVPAYGSIKKHRDWLLGQLQIKRVSLVLSGHLHRHAMFFIVYEANAKPGQNLMNGMAIRVHDPDLASYLSVHGPPVFVNSTCAGPVGHDVQVAGKWLTVRPGFTEITIGNDGKVTKVWERWSDWTM